MSNIKVVIDRPDIVAIADAVRNKTGLSNEMTIEQIVTGIDSIESSTSPSIDISSDGLITATAGTKSSTYQLAFAPAQTITPSTTSQIAVSSGHYTGGNITVAGDANLVADNIKSGVSIFGIDGSYEGGGGVVDARFSDLITGTLTDVNDDAISSIRDYAFYNYSSLTSATFTMCTTIGSSAFQNCSNSFQGQV